ncbi:hypothetical protein FHY16_000535 [Xanthomonas campestris]|nr:hypothetical protein [Xanthomonas euroxanthea]
MVVGIQMGDQGRQRVGDQLQADAAFLQLAFGRAQLCALAALVDAALDGIGQTLQALLHHVIACAARQRLHRQFFGERTGDEDERNFRQQRMRQLQGGVTIEAGQYVVCQNHVVLSCLQRVDECVPGPDPGDGHMQPCGGKLGADQFGVERVVFQHQDANGRVRVCISHSMSSCLVSWDGGAGVGW